MKINHIYCFLIILVLTKIGYGLENEYIQWDKTRKGVGVKGAIQTNNGVLISVRTISTHTGVQVISSRSLDGGETWTQGGIIASDPDSTCDIGDAALLPLHNGTILCSYRQNYYHQRSNQEKSFSIRIAESKDEGINWQYHSTVATATSTDMGLWASFLLQKQNGDIQCYYDDEVTPQQEGYYRHQWLTMKTLNPKENKWIKPVIVSRAFDSKHLSRDGMCTVIELSPNRLLCVFESVRVEFPHKGCIRSVITNDGGKTWSWKTIEREMVYQTINPEYNSLAPWTLKLSNNVLICVFVTDEERPTPDIPSTGILDEDVKAIYSFDYGKNWTKTPQLIANEHPCYLPGIVEITQGKYLGTVLLQYSAKSGIQQKWGKITQ